MDLDLSPDDLDLLFPAYMRLQPDGTIAAIGSSLERHGPKGLVGRGLLDAFEVERPRSVVRVGDLLRRGVTINLRSKDVPGLRLRGAAVERGDIFLLLGHVPPVEDQIGAPNLAIIDFSPSDGALDLMLAAQIREALLDDVTRLAEQLRAKSVEAQAASDAKGRFLATVSHEIRTPMNGVLAMSYALAQTRLEPAQRDMLGVINRSGDALMRIIDDILDFSKIEAGQLRIVEAPFDLEDLVLGVEALYALKAQEKGLKFRVRIEEGGAFLGDATRIRQALSNLVSNAIKFTAKGAVLVTAHVDPLEDDGARLRFVVADSGPGISDDLKERLFAPFTQEAAQSVGGTGLGLSITRELCELMGGDVRFESAPGEGSVFRCSVRVRRVSGPARTVDPGSAEAAAEALRTARLRILAAEDNPTNQIVIRTLLEPLGVDLVVARNGREALEYWGAQAFDLLLMDVEMPDMNGIEAAHAIRTREREDGRSPVAIAALTANVMSHQVDRYRAAGFDAWIAKPIRPARLYETIRTLISKDGFDSAA